LTLEVTLPLSRITGREGWLALLFVDSKTGSGGKPTL